MDSKYRRMLAKMKTKVEKNSPQEPWFLYILECNDGSFYTGVTKDLERRFRMHSDGRASRFTRSRRPVKLIYREDCAGRTAALVRECAVKSLTRKEKEKLVHADA